MAVTADMDREHAKRMHRIGKQVGTGVVLRKTQGSLMFQVVERALVQEMEVVWAAVYVARYEPYIDPDGDLILDREIGTGDFEWHIPPAWFRRFLRTDRADMFKVRVAGEGVRYVEFF